MSAASISYTGSRIPCPKCPKNLASQSLLEAHLAVIHNFPPCDNQPCATSTTNSPKYRCPKCDFAYEFEDDLQIHSLTDHYEPEPTIPQPQPVKEPEPPPLPTCSICMESITDDKTYVISTCLHLFCRTCVLQHTLVCVEDRKIPIKCPEKECNEVLTQMEIKYLLENLQDKFDLYLKLELQLCGDFVKGLHACPRQDCPGMVEGSRPNTRELALCPVCQMEFCTMCKAHPYHYSSSCIEYKEFQRLHLERIASRDSRFAEKKKQQEAEAASLKIIREQFVPCPKCFSPIEKNAGCAHMTCTRCGQEYCDRCLDLITRTKERGLCHLNINCLPQNRAEKLKQFWEARERALQQQHTQVPTEVSFEHGFNKCGCCASTVAPDQLFWCLNCPGEFLVCATCELAGVHTIEHVLKQVPAQPAQPSQSTQPVKPQTPPTQQSGTSKGGWRPAVRPKFF